MVMRAATVEIFRAVSQGEVRVKAGLRGNRAEMTVESEMETEICMVNASLCACLLLQS